MGATRVNCMILLILAGASYMSTSMGYTGIPQALAAWVDSLQLSPYALIAALTVMYIVLGTALDGISMIVLTTAIVIPMIKQAGFDLGLVRHFPGAGGGDGGGVAAGRLQSVRAADHERQGFQYRRAAPRCRFSSCWSSAVAIITVFPDIVMVLPRMAFPG